MKENRFFHLKRFIFYQSLWGLLCVAFGFLFVLLQARFQSPYLLNIFIYTWCGSGVGFIILSILLHGGLSWAGINVELPGARCMNTKIVNNKVDPGLNKEELKRLFYTLKGKSKTTLIVAGGFGFVVVIITLLIMYLAGASSPTLVLVFIGGVIAISLLIFFGLFYEEQVYSEILRDCRKKIKNKGVYVTEDQLFSLKNRFNYFIFLFFLLLIVILSFANDLDPLLWFMVICSFVAVLAVNKMIASSIYSFFEEVESFAGQLPLNKGARFFSGSYYKEAAVIAGNLNESACKLEESNRIIEEEKYKIDTIIVNFIDPILFINKDNELTLFNSAAKRVLGFKEADLGKKMPREDGLSMRDFKSLIRKKEYEIKDPDEVEGYKKGGEEFHIKDWRADKVFKVVTRKVYGKNGRYHGILKIFNDLTREEAVNNLKSEFISVAAHQLRTPLSAIKWILKMIIDEDAGGMNKEQKEFMQKGYSSTQRVIELVENLLYVSRIEEGRFGYEFSYFDFEEVVDNSVEKLKDDIEQKDLKFNIDKSEQSTRMYGDPEKLDLALYYILDNAVKYTPQNGTVELRVRKKKESEYLEVKVEDNGVGIPPEGLDKMFSKFHRGANVLRMETEGNGLGMFIVKSIVEEHEGTVDVQSEEAKGTEVTFLIPMKKSQKKNAKKK